MKQSQAAMNLGNAYEHMDYVANIVVFRSYKAEKEPSNMLKVKRVREAEVAFHEATQSLQEAFQDVFEEQGVEFGKAYNMAKAAAESAAHSLRMKAWDELRAVSA